MEPHPLLDGRRRRLALSARRLEQSSETISLQTSVKPTHSFNPTATASSPTGTMLELAEPPPRRDQMPTASPLGPLLTGDGPQHRPLDSADRSGRADRDHQDPQTTGLRSGGTDYPLGAPIDPASSPALALGRAVQPRPGTAASDSIPPDEQRRCEHPTKPNVPANSRQPPPRGLLPPSAAQRPPVTRSPCGDCRRHWPPLPEIARIACPSSPIPLLNTSSPQWIWA